MKTTNIFFIILFSFLLSILIPAQDINVHYMIGKKQNDVIKKYGNPVHRDDSNPDMLCMFYKSKQNTMIFVANKKEVYQSEALKSYDSDTEARKELDACILGSQADGFAIDSVTTTDFRLRRSGIKADLQLTENKLSAKYEIRVKANRTED